VGSQLGFGIKVLIPFTSLGLCRLVCLIKVLPTGVISMFGLDVPPQDPFIEKELVEASGGGGGIGKTEVPGGSKPF